MDAFPFLKIGCWLGNQPSMPIQKPDSPGRRTSGTLTGGGGDSGTRLDCWPGLPQAAEPASVLPAEWRWRGRRLLARRILVRRRGGPLRGAGCGRSLFGGLRIGLFLLRAAGHVAGYQQQAGTNKASQRILHLRLIGINFRRIRLKADH